MSAPLPVCQPTAHMTGFDLFLNHLGDWILYAGSAVLVCVVVYYHLTARWWRTREGRHIMAWTFFTALILVFLSTAIAGALNIHVRLYIRVIVYGLFLWLGIWRFQLISQAQKIPPSRGETPSERPPFHA